MSELLNEIVYLFQRLTWMSVLDLFLVTLVVYAVLLLLRDTQVMVLLRGVIIIIVLLALLIYVDRSAGVFLAADIHRSGTYFLPSPLSLLLKSAADWKNWAGLVQLKTLVPKSSNQTSVS